ncbi:hypothetical protein BCIN_01g01020 [Botrytis cinerea B05.10]|uniref:Uncharacterized protein n=1 Tax=Botryotinia fuckeliana (strain B05.10) TaxID=332648 RepID=A0A384J448_BOTFB|nr:hypothetical protein BCIN_01g01020 [Botrytis cinerea B05.10]ATZ45294.1 hypothetical protein BCIN_01g01020 [Botrytis cinerea B05.10]
MRSLGLNAFAGILFFLGSLQLAATVAVFIEPYAKIAQFRATVIVPKAPTILQATGIQSFWPALEPANSNSILQIVFANEGNTVGRWSFFEYFQLGNASAGGERIHGKNINVYPGDLISSGFISIDGSEQWGSPTNSSKWYVNWVVRRGAEGLANGEINFMGNETLDLSPYPDIGDFTQATLATELNRAAKWEIGPLDWKNVLIQIEGTNTDWCSVDKLILSNATLSNIEAVKIYPSITGMTCFFTGFTVTDSTAVA